MKVWLYRILMLALLSLGLAMLLLPFNSHYSYWDINSAINPVEGDVQNLGLILKLTGAVLTVLGLVLARQLYKPKQGIMIAPPWVAILWDMITLIITVLAAYIPVCTLLAKTLSVTCYVNDDSSVFMGYFFFFFGMPFVAFYTSRFTAQTVQIDTEGVKVYGLFENDNICWDAIQSLGFTDEYVMVGRLGVMMPKKLQKVLLIKDSLGRQVKINEPQLKSIKQEIILRFMQYAPDKIRGEYKALLSEW